ncbi:hypothetical protein MRB53_014676 [Persea americana]|uniref:Uncharacterized protein n=1 Tax=Persea americana TaxID=3435 RepID=A0ACC2KC31_PERAE|nr:hypothetical protein MRB53_014676 [Persea americana]|eukprot:TRINITY_DN50168_c2_g1_i1.p1 TRINITY_DN50168_c2_g1~~TRINITY_DN50168_c2_g1_i1.p1  ORF type:complete len:196 (+),score=23.67 TRINITY_DN50168_c2_g1_i1:315-902(+)
MAALSIPLLLLFSLLSLSAIAVSARPGIHFLSISYTISSSKSDSSLQNQPSFFAFYREFHDFDPKPFHPSSRFFIERPDFPQISSSIDHPGFPQISHEPPRETQIPRPVPLIGSFASSSLRERTQDILSIVFALLFGASCGMLTAATIYLIWSVISSRGDVQEAFDGDESDEEAVKDMGYAKIPESPKKEGYVGN